MLIAISSPQGLPDCLTALVHTLISGAEKISTVQEAADMIAAKIATK